MLYFLIILFFLSLVFLGLRRHRQKQQLHMLSLKQDDQTVTLFIPGYNGNRISLGGMVKRLDQAGVGTWVSTTTIHKDGTFSEEHRSKKRQNAMIQLLFDDNRNPVGEITQLYPYLVYLKKQGFTQMNLVGHSTGGEMSVGILTRFPNDLRIPQACHLVSIGGDFPVPPKPEEVQRGKKLPQNLHVLVIAGRIFGRPTDGLVKEVEVRAMEPIVKPNVASYQTIFVSGSPFRSFHFMLHENLEIDRLVATFIWHEQTRV